MKTVQYNDIKSMVGQEIGVSDWLEIDQDRINLFADATGDHQWIHVDEDRAKSEMGSTIAHGYLTLSLIPMLAATTWKVEGVTRGINYGCNKVRFTNMVPVNSRVRGRSKIKEVTEKAGGLQLITEWTIEIEGQDKPACIAETVGILYN